MTNFKKQGKKNRAAGQRFELKVRKDLEYSGWIVSKWMNNVLIQDLSENVELPNGKIKHLELKNFSLIPSKHKFRGPGIPMAIGTGFPDFVTFKISDLKDVCPTLWDEINGKEQKYKIEEIAYKIVGVEVKSNGYLNLEEKEKCKWYIENKIFSNILIASKGKKRGEIVYQDVKEILLKGGRKKEKC